MDQQLFMGDFVNIIIFLSWLDDIMACEMKPDVRDMLTICRSSEAI